MFDTNYDYDLLVEQQLEDLLESTMYYESDAYFPDEYERGLFKHSFIEYGEDGVTWTANPLGGESMAIKAALLRLGRASLDLLISDDDQESLFKPKTTAFEVTTSTSIEEENANLEKYQKSRMPAVLKSEAEEVKIYSDINTEAFLATRFDTVIDWLDLKFTVDPKKCDFWLDPKARSFIKAFITRQTGTRHYVADKSEVVQDGASFTIRLHDLNSRKSLRTITSLLSAQYGCKVEDMTIEAIELSLDFYNAQNSALLIALHKSLKYPPIVNRMRVYKTEKTARAVPESPYELHKLFEDGYNLATGDHRSEEFCTRMYIKRTDNNGTPLPLSQHRLRAEVTLRKTFFAKANIDCSLDNLPMMINHGFKQLNFTKLSDRVTEVDRKNYRDFVQPFGQQQRIERSCSGHKRRLLPQIESFGMLNERKRLRVKALADKFKMRKNR